MSNVPTLAANTFVDKAIATCGICLWEKFGGGTTNAVQLLVRPTDIRIDESGECPGEKFVMLTITREELRKMLRELDEDWGAHLMVIGRSNNELATA